MPPSSPASAKYRDDMSKEEKAILAKEIGDLEASKTAVTWCSGYGDCPDHQPTGVATYVAGWVAHHHEDASAKEHGWGRHLRPATTRRARSPLATSSMFAPRRILVNPLALSNYQLITYTTMSNRGHHGSILSKVHSGMIGIAVADAKWVEDAFDRWARETRSRGTWSSGTFWLDTWRWGPEGRSSASPRRTVLPGSAFCCPTTSRSRTSPKLTCP